MITNINNYGMKLIDFISPYDDYSKVYDVWYNQLKEFAPLFVDKILYKDFIKRFIDRYYNRFIATQTITEFIIRFKNFLNTNKETATRLYHLKDLELELFFTNYQITKNELKGFSSNYSTNNNKFISNNNNVNSGTAQTLNNTNLHTGKNIHTTTIDNFEVNSDLPKSAIDRKDLFTKEIYATNSNHNKNKTKNIDEFNETNSNKASTKNRNESSSFNNGSSENTIDGVADNTQDVLNETYGYNGNIQELLNSYINVSLDVINFYLDEVEHFGLFSKILY